MQSWIYSKHIVEVVLYASHNKYMSHIKLLQKSTIVGILNKLTVLLRKEKREKTSFLFQHRGQLLLWDFEP